MTIPLITTTAALAEAAERAAQEPFVTIDTEFMRETTYYAKLCLVQFAWSERGVLVDPLAPELSLEPLFQLLDNPRVVKVFHAARQDVEIFYHLTGRTPVNLFDTQVAAMVAGLGESVGYEALIRETIGEEVDKSSRFTDWSRRPLSDKQSVYALADVTLLHAAYAKLHAQIDAAGRMAWVAEEMAALTDPALYATAPDDAWQRLKLRSGSRKALACLKTLAAWREREAQGRDVPRGRILKDDALTEVAQRQPRTIADLEGLRAVPRGFAQSRYGSAVLAAIEAGLALPADQIPRFERGPARTPADPGVIDMLKLLLKLRAEAHGVAPRLIASADEVERLAGSNDESLPALQGWRRELFGADALALKAGRLMLKVEDGAVSVVAV